MIKTTNLVYHTKPHDILPTTWRVSHVPARQNSISSDRACSAIAIPVGNALFLKGLITEIPRQTQDIAPQSVVDAGPTKLTIIARNPVLLQALRLSYLKGVKYSLYLAVASVAVAVPFAVAMKWRTLGPATQEEEVVGTSAGDEEKTPT